MNSVKSELSYFSSRFCFSIVSYCFNLRVKIVLNFIPGILSTQFFNNSSEESIFLSAIFLFFNFSSKSKSFTRHISV